jgi:integrase
MSDISPWFDYLNDNNVPEGIRKQRHKVIDLLAEKHPEAAAARHDVKLDKASIDALLMDLSKKVSTAEISQCTTFLARILEYGRIHLNWDVHIPGVPVTLRPPKNRFSVGKFQVAEVRKIKRAFLGDLANSPPEMEQRVGQILLSATLAGMLKPRNQRYFLDNLAESELLISDLFCVTVHDAENRRQLWFADPVTLGLIARLHRDHPVDICEISSIHTPGDCIRQYLDYLDPTLFFGLVEMRKQCSNLLSMHLLPVLQDYAAGKIPATSLPIATWKRIVSGKALEITTTPDHQPQEHFIPSFSFTYAQNTGKNITSQQILLWKKLVKRLGSHKATKAAFRREINNFLIEHGKEIYPPLYYIAQWGIELITTIPREIIKVYPGRDKCALRPNSALSYMSDIGKYFITAGLDSDPTDMDSHELEEFYQQTVELCPVSSINKRNDSTSVAFSQRCAESLRRFHGFMQMRYGAPTVNFSGICSSEFNPKTRVDANLVTPAEYDRIQKVIRGNQNLSRLRRIQSLLVMLGFRCGLRRGECLRLRICDLQPSHDPIILIRNSRYGKTKSLAGVRKLPLKVLLDPDSLETLLDWREQRIVEAGSNKPDTLMFALDNHQMPHENELFSSIRVAMHQVTGDKTLRFHHLRHSFANWTLIKLLRDDISWQDLPFFRLDEFSQESCKTFRRGLLANGDQGTKHLHELARLMGHESPGVTLQSYIHMLDWILHRSQFMPTCEPELNVTSIASLTGLSKDQIYFQAKKSGETKSHCWYLSNFIHRASGLPIASMPEVDPDLRPIPRLGQAERPLVSLHLVISTLLTSLAEGLAEKKLSQRMNILGVTRAELERWKDNAEWIKELKTKRGHLRHLNVNTRKNGIKVFPAPIKTKAEQELSKKIIRHISTAEDTRQTLKKFLRYFLLNYTTAEDGLLLEDLKLVNAYLHRLRSVLGIQKNQICVTAQMPKTHPGILRRKEKELRKYCPDAGHVASVIADACRKSVKYSIKVINPDDKRNNSKRGIYYSNYGFRYTLYILAIAFFDAEDRL